MSLQQIARFFLAFALLTAPAMAIAQQASLPPDAQAALKKGLDAAAEQKWEVAIQNFQEARQIAPGAPEIYYDLGLAESKIPGRELRAVAWFGAYLAASPDAPNAPAVKKFISELRIKINANIDRLIQAAEAADNSLPDTPIRHDGGITGKLTNKADQDRIRSLYDVANLWASAGNSANALQAAHRIGQAGYSEPYSLSQIAVAQADAGYVADAIKTAASFNDPVWSKTASLAIAAAQAKAGDMAGARATLAATQQRASKDKSAYIRNSDGIDIGRAQAKIGDISGAQKNIEMMPGPVARTWVYLAIAEAQTRAGDLATARASLAMAQKAADLWNSLTAAQKKTACNCDLSSEPGDQSTLALLQRNIGQMLEDTGDLAGARSALRSAQRYVRLISRADSRSSEAASTADALAKSGDIAAAQEMAKLTSQGPSKTLATRSIVSAQARAGDIAGAQKTAEATRDPAEMGIAKSLISIAQAASSTQAVKSDTTKAPAANPVISVSDWISELNALDNPLFLDLPGSVKAPQQAYRTPYSDPSETDTKRTFKALVAIAQNIISARDTVDQMLKRQFGQAAKP